MTRFRSAFTAYAAPTAAGYWVLLLGTGVAATVLYALGPLLMRLGGFTTGLVACALGCASEPAGRRALEALEALHNVVAVVTLSGVAVTAGWLIGRLSPRRPRVVAWAVGLVVVLDGALALGLPPAPPDWVSLLRPVLRVPAAWYLPTMWYQMEPLLDAARLALLLPAILVGVRIGAARRARAAGFISPAA